MKKAIILLSALIVCTFPCYSQQVTASVDERFELTSIVFRLAGVNKEYQKCDFEQYANDIDQYFAPYADHELLEYIRELRTKTPIAYDAIPTSTSLLEIKNGHIVRAQKYRNTDIAELDPRWNEEFFTHYIKLLNRFYRESDFHSFFTSHEELYRLVEEKMNTAVLKEINFNWFDSFYGIPFAEQDIKIYLSITNGPNNYAVNDCVLIGIPATENQPNINFAFTYTCTYTLMHELNHHYTTPLMDKYWPQMEKAAMLIYPYVKEEMARIAYRNAKTTFYEWLTNLFTIMYYKEMWPTSNFADVRTRLDMNKGFIWMKRSVEFMENFYQNRIRYNFIEAFMPQLAFFLDFTATNFEHVETEFDNRRPYVTNVYPAPGSDISQYDFIYITFSQPMRKDCKGIWEVDDQEITLLPVYYETSAWLNEYTFVYVVDHDALQPGSKYGIRIPAFAYLSKTDYSMADTPNVDLIYYTASESD